VYTPSPHRQESLPLPSILVKDNRDNLYGWQMEKGNLSVKTCRETPTWSSPEIISSKALLYDVTFSDKEGLCTALVDYENSVTLFKGYPGNWREETFYREEKDKKIKTLQILADRERKLHLIYLATSERGERWWLFHLRYDNGKWEDPRVIDFGGGSTGNYGYAMIDRYNRVYFVYRLKEEERVPLYYRVFSSPELNWSRPLLLAPEGDNTSPFLVEDDSLNLHLIWCSRRENGYLMMYRHRLRGTWPAGKWFPPIELSLPLSYPACPFLEISPEEIKACWIDRQGKHLRYSFNNGKHWDISRSYPLSQGEKPVKMICHHPDGPPRITWTTGKGEPPLPHEKSRPQKLEVEKSIKKINSDQKKKSKELKEETGNTSDHEDFTLDLEELQTTTGTIFSEATRLNRSQYLLQHELERKSPEVQMVSYQRQQKLESLKKNLQQKEREILEIQESFTRALGNLKHKLNQAHQTWNEKFYYLNKENQELKQNHQNAQTILKEKEGKIKKIEKENQKLQEELKDIKIENRQLKKKLEEKSSLGSFPAKKIEKENQKLQEELKDIKIENRQLKKKLEEKSSLGSFLGKLLQNKPHRYK